MRCALLTHEPFHPPSGGGSAEAVYLVEALVRRGHQVDVFCPQFDDVDTIASRMGCRFHLFTGWKMGRYARFRNLKYLLYPSRLEKQVFQTERSLRSESGAASFDLILAQHTIAAVAAGRLRRCLAIPTVLNYLDFLTGFLETWPSWSMPRSVVRRLTQFELSLPRRYNVEGVMTVSFPLAERLRLTGYPASQIRAIQYGYDASCFRLPIKSPVHADRPLRVVMHGSFDRHHLGPIARGAVAEVWKQRPAVHFRFVGRITPSLQAFVRQMEHSCPGVHIELTGFIPYAEVARQLWDSDVGMVPYEESNGTHCAFVAKAVEYLGCGLPVASTPLENLQRYFANEPAMSFSRFDGADLARVILQWLDRPPLERRHLGRKASKRVSSELDWQKVTGEAVDFMESVLELKKGRAP